MTKLIVLLLVAATSAQAQPVNATNGKGSSWEITVDVFEGTLQGFFSEGEVSSLLRSDYFLVFHSCFVLFHALFLLPRSLFNTCFA
jgi:hypothetical protein